MANTNGSRNFRISVTKGMRGFYAVMLADYEDIGWSTDVVLTGIGSYRTSEAAEEEAKQWAACEGLQFVQ